MNRVLCLCSALALWAAAAPAAAQDDSFDFDESEVDVIEPTCEIEDDTSERYVNKVGGLLYERLDLTYEALGQGIERFETTLQFASTSEAETRYAEVVLKQTVDTLVEMAIDVAMAEMPEAAKTAVKGVKALAVKVYEERERAAKAAQSASAGAWIRRVGSDLVEHKPSRTQVTNWVYGYYCELPEPADTDFLFGLENAVTEDITGIGEVALITLYEQWINAHFEKPDRDEGIVDDFVGAESAPGVLDVWFEGDEGSMDERVTRVVLSDGTPYADKLCPAIGETLARFNRKTNAGATLLDLRIHKRLCFEVRDRGGVGTLTDCALLGPANEVTIAPVWAGAEARAAYRALQRTACIED